MKNLITILLIFVLISCDIADRKTRIAREMFNGFQDKIQSIESIKEVNPDEKTAKTIIIADNSNNSLSLEELIDSTYYIKLDDRKNILIEAIDKILFINNKICIYDKQKKRGLFLFSDKGKFLNKIGNFGKGKEEYLTISDIAINRKTNNIILLDEYGRNILYYDVNGKFIKKEKIYYFSKDLSILDDGSFVFYQLEGENGHLGQLNNYSLLLADGNQLVTNYAFPYKNKASFPSLTYGRLINLISSSESTLFNPHLSNNIYQIINSNKIVLKYKFNMGDKDVLAHISNETNNKQYLELINENKYFHFDGEMLETHEHLYFKYGNYNFGFFNKKTTNMLCGNSFSYRNKDNSSYVLFNTPISIKNNWFVSVIWPYKLSKYQMEVIEKTNNSTYEIFKGIKPQDNPILMFFKLKHF